MGNILLPCIAVCGSIYMCVFYVYYPECARNILWSRLLKKGNGCLGNHILDMLDEEWLRIRRPKEGNLDLHAPAWLIAVKERMLELIQTKLLKSTHWHWMCYKFMIVGTVFNLAKVNTVPCMCAATLTLSFGPRKQCQKCKTITCS